MNTYYTYYKWQNIKNFYYGSKINKRTNKDFKI